MRVSDRKKLTNRVPFVGEIAFQTASFRLVKNTVKNHNLSNLTGGHFTISLVPSKL